MSEPKQDPPLDSPLDPGLAACAPQAAKGNIASRLKSIAKLIPSGIAIAEPSGPPVPGGARSYSLTTFDELDKTSDAIARGLVEWGVRPGMRMAMLVPFSGQFITLVFALLKAGAVGILIDPGIGRQHLLKCLSEANPDGVIGIPKAQLIRCLCRSKFATAKFNVTVGRKFFWGGKTLDTVRSIGQANASIELPSISITDPAAIIFTTGSTGPPKGVLYTHGTFHSQVDRIRVRYDIHRGSRDLACFPLFGLFDAVMGVTTIIPDMDPTRPAAVNPERLIEAAAQWEVDQSFGSPALWNTVVRYCEANQITDPFPTLRRVLSAGAPVPAKTLAKLRSLLHEDVNIVTPYGATEALPIASIESRQVISQTGPAAAKGKGVCVGTRFEDVEWKIIEIDDGPIQSIGDSKELDRGKIGELLVTGPMVTREYVVRADQNALHKVADGDRVWHRMGDVGYLDEYDQFWFCGRKAHRVVVGNRTLFTIPCEAIFNTHPKVYRSALIGRGERPNQSPVVMIELEPKFVSMNATERESLRQSLLEVASRNPITRRIDEIIIRDKPLPVDIRHNSKIFREKLVAELS